MSGRVIKHEQDWSQRNINLHLIGQESLLTQRSRCQGNINWLRLHAYFPTYKYTTMMYLKYKTDKLGTPKSLCVSDMCSVKVTIFAP